MKCILTASASLVASSLLESGFKKPRCRPRINVHVPGDREKRIKSIKLRWTLGELNLTLQSHFIGELFETCHFVSDPLTTDQLDERICDDIQCREKAKDRTGGRQFRRESYPKIVPCLSLSIELCIHIYICTSVFVGSCLNLIKKNCCSLVD